MSTFVVDVSQSGSVSGDDEVVHCCGSKSGQSSLNRQGRTGKRIIVSESYQVRVPGIRQQRSFRGVIGRLDQTHKVGTDQKRIENDGNSPFPYGCRAERADFLTLHPIAGHLLCKAEAIHGKYD